MKRVIFLIAAAILFCQPLFAESEKALFEKGVALMKTDQYQEAVAVFTRFIDLAPENPDAYKNRGVAHMKLGEYDLAILDFEKTREIKPDLKGLYSNLGVAWYYKGDYHQAIKNYNMEIALTPDNYYAFFNRAICRAELDQLTESLEDVNRSLALFPEFYLAHCLRGDLLAKMDKVELAREAYEQAQRIDPEHGYATEKIAALPPREAAPVAQAEASAAPDTNDAAVTKEIRQMYADPTAEAQETASVTASAPEPEAAAEPDETPAPPSETASGDMPAFELQAGAFLSEKNALELEQELKDKGLVVRRFELTRPSGKLWYLVRTGGFDTKAQAEAARAETMAQTGLDFIVRPYGVF